MPRIIIFANGELPDIKKIRAFLRPDDYIICADGGTRHALALKLKPDLVIGDMDSVQKGHWQKLKTSGISMELFPRDKNETDLELAVNRAIEKNLDQIVIVAAWVGVLIRHWATLHCSPTCASQRLMFDSTMGWRKYSFAGIKPRSREEAVISSP